MKSSDAPFIIVLLFFIFVFYFWTAAGGSNNFNPKYNVYNYYNKLTDGFLKGKLHLLEEPSSEILASPDPYDPAKRLGHYLWDTALYKGKYYLYHGITPIVTFYLPYKLLFKKDLSDYLVTLIFMFGGFIWSTLFLLYVRDKYFKNIPTWVLLFAVSVLGFSNIAPYMLRRLADYQVAISGGFFFLMGGIYFLCRALDKLKSSKYFLMLGSLFLGLAVGSRTHLILAAVLLLIFMCVKVGFDKNRKTLKSGLVLNMIVLFLPFMICLLFIALYNYLRFDNLFEFGYRYQLGIAVDRFFNINGLILNLYFYLFYPPTVDSTFPFFHIFTYFPHYLVSVKDYHFEKIVGMFTTVPFVLTPLFYFLVMKSGVKRESKGSISFPTFEFLMVFIPGCLILMFLLFLSISNMRYVTDFVSYFILAASVLWFYFDSTLLGLSISKFFLRTTAVTLATISIIFGAAFGIEGCEYDQGRYGLLAQRPNEFKKLEKFFKPISDIILKYKPD